MTGFHRTVYVHRQDTAVCLYDCRSVYMTTTETRCRFIMHKRPAYIYSLFVH